MQAIRGTAATAIMASLALTGCDADERTSNEGRLQLKPREALSAPDTTGFERALTPRPFAFPRDHGSHPTFRTEWWYVTGNLEGDGGRRFGYQLTIFRNALRAEQPQRDSNWAVRDAWFAHLGITDVEGNTMHGAERFSREALGLAGAESTPFRVWLEDWEIRSIRDDSFFPLHLRARHGDVAIDVVLETDAPVLQGKDGLSQKSGEPGNASFYYSFPRMPTEGHITIGAQSYSVDGTSWFDREWSTSALAEDQAGWDWFALQLDDGRDLMFYRLRTKAGATSPSSAGVLVDPDGTRRALGPENVSLSVASTWDSPHGSTYPATWRVAVQGSDLALTVRPVLADQEHDFVVRYWEGAVDVLEPGGARIGVGYVEMTGYE